MITAHKNGVSFLKFPKLAQCSAVEHGIFTRHDGESKGPFRSLNVSFGVGDDHNDVIQNRRILAQCFEENPLIFADQVHGVQVRVLAQPNTADTGTEAAICHEAKETDIIQPPDGILDLAAEQKLRGDALVTDKQKVFLVIQVADCQSILLYDPVRQVVANVHSGWRGSVSNIVGRTIRVMERRFDCVPQDMIAGIGPSLGPCCAEFVNYKEEIPRAFWKYKDHRDHFDFWSASQDQLVEAGVLMNNVDLCTLCTKCNPDLFFSFRGEGDTGRFAVIIGLNQSREGSGTAHP